jgi:hypothetical protein
VRCQCWGYCFRLTIAGPLSGRAAITSNCFAAEMMFEFKVAGSSIVMVTRENANLREVWKDVCRNRICLLLFMSLGQAQQILERVFPLEYPTIISF